ncbi:MAG: NAD(P)-binding domain-containing protein, partial [Deltaproteobacteria bacterium]|nr:NAD(P)-binding domain-containing protein [Deltaproteobacteria bacterium]
MPSKVGIFGLSTMGKNLALNFSDNDVSVSVFNRTSSVTKEFVRSENRKNLVGFELVEDFINSLDKPRIVLLLVKSDAVDSVLGLLKKSLEFDDIVVDLGNSYFRDSKLRAKLFEGNFIFCDCGISGGEKGARHGASFMIGGSGEAPEKLKEVLAKVSAFKGDYSCVEIFEGAGAGHFVKMTHNAIEYAVMQMYAELYALFIRLRYSTEQVIEVFEKLRQKGLDSYLLSITIDILKYDLKNNILRRIVEEAGQKGTGRWTSQTALDWGIGVPTLSAAVEARNLSSYFSQFSQRLSTVMTSGCNQSLDIDMLVDSIKLVYLTTYEQGVQLFKRSLV